MKNLAGSARGARQGQAVSRVGHYSAKIWLPRGAPFSMTSQGIFPPQSLYTLSKRYWMKCNTSARSPYFMSTAKEFYYISFSSLEISQCTHKIQLNKQKFKVYLHKLAWCCVVYNKDNQNKLNSCKYWISMKNKNIYISTLFTNVNSPKITMRNQVD